MERMKARVLAIFSLSLLFHVLSCAPPQSGQAQTSGGLGLTAALVLETADISSAPLIRVTFTNVSGEPIALLNHFAFCAEGPSLSILLLDSSAEQGFRRYIFEKQLSLRDASPKWIVLKANESYTFTSAVAFPDRWKLPIGRNRLQVSYMCGPAARAMIEECRKDPEAPQVFWQGEVLSNVIEVELEKQPVLGP